MANQLYTWRRGSVGSVVALYQMVVMITYNWGFSAYFNFCSHRQSQNLNECI